MERMNVLKLVFLVALAVAFVFASAGIAIASGFPWYGVGFVVALLWILYIGIAKFVYDL